MSYNKTHRGIYTPKNPSKWVLTEASHFKGTIKYLSGWERKFMVWADMNPKVVLVSSEPFPIKYHSPVDNKMHKYFIDFYVEVKQLDGSIRKLAIEIKPKVQCLPPKKTRNKIRYVKEMKTYVTNQAKWAAARTFSIKQGWDFVILTEHELGISK
jgi:hypothetical protein